MPKNIKKEIAYHAWKYDNPEARKWASKKYPKFSFKKETVRDWKNKYQKNFQERQVRPLMVSDELVTRIKTILHNRCVSDGAIIQKTVIAIGNGVLSSRCPEKLTKIRRSVILATKWARGKLKLLDWVKRRDTIAKKEINLALYEELTFTWNRQTANAIFEHRIQNEMILNFDQTSLGFTASKKQHSLKKVLNQSRLPMSMINME